MPAQSRNNAPGPHTLPPPPARASASRSAGRGKRPPKHVNPPSHVFSHFPPPPDDQSSGIPLPPPPADKRSGQPLPLAQEVAYIPLKNKNRKRLGFPSPPAEMPFYNKQGKRLNTHLSPAPSHARFDQAAPFDRPFTRQDIYIDLDGTNQGGAKRPGGKQNDRKIRAHIVEAPFIPAPPSTQGKPRPHTHQRPEPIRGPTHEELYSDIASDSFYDPLPVTHEPAPRKAGPHGRPLASRQSSISSSSSDASAFTIGSTDSQYTTLQEEDHISKDKKKLIKFKTFRSPRYGMDTIVDVIPIEPGRISKTMSVLSSKKEFSPKPRLKVTPVPARDDHYRMQPSAARK